MKYISVINQRRLGDFGFRDKKGNINKTPEWVFGGNKMSKLQEMEMVESEEFDVSQYVGKKTKIESMSVETGKHGKYLKVVTEDIGEGLKVSNVYGLVEKDGKVSIAKLGKLAELMKNKKVTDYRDLIGKEVVILAQNKEGKDWLYFA